MSTPAVSIPTTHMPGLTGLRGIAVVAVIAYHLGYLPGGFLGVDVFFVLSGFLITTLLLRNTPDSPRGLMKWWTKRFTRLTPAVVVVVIAVLVVFATTSGIVWDAIATTTWWQNWHLIAQGKPYWASGPSPLRHAWSLSIEEQFYALWPLMMITTGLAARRFTRVHPKHAVAALALVLATGSFAWGWYLAASGSATLSRVYFGTDTRAGALLIGCAAAALLHGHRLAPARWGLTTTAAVAELTLVVLSITLTPESRVTYTGGLVAAAVCSLLLILTVTREGPLSSMLSWSPLQWLGVRSYALYLWSWPVQVLAQDRLPDAPLAAIAAITVAASALLSMVSLRLVENPLRRSMGWATRPRPRHAAWVGGTAVLAIALLVAANSTQLTVSETVAKEFERLPDPTTTVAPATTTTCPPATLPPTTIGAQFSDETADFDPSTVTDIPDPLIPAPGATVPCAPVVERVLIVGDSTGRGAANGLRRQALPDMEVWDRTDLGCGLIAPGDSCPDWRVKWTDAIAQIDPDVVVVYVRTTDDLIAGADPEFMSEDAQVIRQATMTEATQILSSSGAEVIWIAPAVPGYRGAFYCKGRRTNSPCDPEWVGRWRNDVVVVASQNGTAVIDVQAWIDSRPDTADTDRPDGLHFSGPALDQHAAWLAEQIRAASP